MVASGDDKNLPGNCTRAIFFSKNNTLDSRVPMGSGRLTVDTQQPTASQEKSQNMSKTQQNKWLLKLVFSRSRTLDPASPSHQAEQQLTGFQQPHLKVNLGENLRNFQAWSTKTRTHLGYSSSTCFKVALHTFIDCAKVSAQDWNSKLGY